MKVKIEGKIYCSDKIPIMLILDETDKENIRNMEDLNNYLSFPEDITQSEAEIYMSILNIMDFNEEEGDTK